MNHNRNLKYILKHIFPNKEYNKSFKITRKDRADELEGGIVAFSKIAM